MASGTATEFKWFKEWLEARLQSSKGLRKARGSATEFKRFKQRL